MAEQSVRQKIRFSMEFEAFSDLFNITYILVLSFQLCQWKDQLVVFVNITVNYVYFLPTN